ncbi:unannotated protein [freshwater metagenome]|uniref:Unannotated protein n=1 Tax=freshwater metagenome TaxID=449393 RepID=A0A6J7R4A1_9ZZZZ
MVPRARPGDGDHHLILPEILPELSTFQLNGLLGSELQRAPCERRYALL